MKRAKQFVAAEWGPNQRTQDYTLYSNLAILSFIGGPD